MMEQPVRVDRIVAVVGERLVTQSDVALEELLHTLDPSPIMVLRTSTLLPLQIAIDRAIIRGLAGSTAVYAPAEEDVRARVAAVMSRIESEGGWDAFQDLTGMTLDRLTGIVYSRLVVERYIQRNVELAARNTDIQAYYSEWIAVQRQRTSVRMVPEMESLTP